MLLSLLHDREHAHSSKFSPCVGESVSVRCRASWDSLNLARVSSRGGSQTVIHCAHWATTALSWGLCEQEWWSGCSLLPALRAKKSRDI